MNHKMLYAYGFWLLGISLHASELQIITKAGANHFVAIDSVETITFGQASATLIVAERHNKQAEFALFDIRKMTYEQESSAIEKTHSPSAGSFTLHPNYPNPFNPSTTISFELFSAEWVTMRIYNIHGQIINTLVDDYLLPGHHTIHWEGRDHWGSIPATGVYFIELRNEQAVQVQKCLFIE